MATLELSRKLFSFELISGFLSDAKPIGELEQEFLSAVTPYGAKILH
jgi:hypothetical protein